MVIETVYSLVSLRKECTDVVTLKLKGCPVTAVALVALVKAGADSGTTVSVKAWVV